jgi:hypothetical protein
MARCQREVGNKSIPNGPMVIVVCFLVIEVNPEEVVEGEK